jgi:hypothetical protein
LALVRIGKIVPSGRIGLGTGDVITARPEGSMREFLETALKHLISFLDWVLGNLGHFLGWLSEKTLTPLGQLETEDKIIIGATLFVCISVVDRLRKRSYGRSDEYNGDPSEVFHDIRPYGMPYWVLNFMWGCAALAIFLAVTNAFVLIALHIHNWVAKLVAPGLTLAVVLVGSLIVMLALSGRPAFKPFHFIRLVLVRLLPLGIPYGYKLAVLMI